MSDKRYKPKNNIRVITATALFDGHDAAINIMRRILQDTGCEVIHLGHNRSVQEIVTAAIEEDVQGIAMSCYQGGHMESFKYMIDLLKQHKVSHIKVFGGGGGVIVLDEIKELEDYGVAKIYSPEDGTTLGLQGIINHMVKEIDFPTALKRIPTLKNLNPGNRRLIAGLITAFEQSTSRKSIKPNAAALKKIKSDIKKKAKKRIVPVIGITGTGGAGKSSLTDELILRLLNDFKNMHIAVISCDPTRKKTRGALLGDRIRMNAISGSRTYMRSMATRKARAEIPAALPDALSVLKASGFDIIIAETAGIGQGDSKIVDLADFSVYVMTSEFGAASQLEKIEMLDYADIVVVNKYEKQGSEDAVRDVRKQVQRNLKKWDLPLEDLPVFGTIASKFNDSGVTALYHYILEKVGEKTNNHLTSSLKKPSASVSDSKDIIIPPERTNYLMEIAETVREYHGRTEQQADSLRRHWHLEETLNDTALLQHPSLRKQLNKEVKKTKTALDKETIDLLKDWQQIQKIYTKGELAYTVRDREIKVPLYSETLSRTSVPKIVLPNFKDPGEIYRWLREEHLPGYFPYTAGVFPLKRTDEEPTRMFAGEGDPARTNRRFKVLSGDYEAKRLSTAFDSPTLYGCDPDKEPDIYGKVGTSGVSICTLDDVKVLYSGFDLCAPNTSVSMTINGPAPIMLAMFLNAAIDQQVDAFTAKHNKQPSKKQLKTIRSKVLSNIRGTVQADILKEDQGQNTCIFSIEFALKMMGDIQAYFIKNNVQNFYSASISGYHIAEAGANPITQLALTLANGFTYVEYYLSRGMPIDSFAPNLSFFFSNGMDPEYTVIGRVARRIWSIAMKEKYNASERSQMLKYHIQTSGRSLHSQEIQFNDIRTTLQALCAVYDNCSSLHTNAYDEAITTPGDESVRRALAIQMIVNREWGLAKNENPSQGSFIVEELTRLVEEAILLEFDRISLRGGVLGAMETGYQRSKIQEESIFYEMQKDSGKLPIIGVNTFLNSNTSGETDENVELARATEKEKKSQMQRLNRFKKQHKKESAKALKQLQKIALTGGNIFTELMNTVRSCSLGQITTVLNDIGGRHRRSM